MSPTLMNLPAGIHVLKTRAFYTEFNPPRILDSDPVTFTVDAPPSYALVTNLTHDIVLSGAQAFQLVGTPSALWSPQVPSLRHLVCALKRPIQ